MWLSYGMHVTELHVTELHQGCHVSTIMVHMPQAPPRTLTSSCPGAASGARSES
jgi:hypothetical protein